MAGLQRSCQSRRTADAKLRHWVSRAIRLHECGKHQQAMLVEKELAVHVEQLLELGQKTEKAVSALHKALRVELSNHPRHEVTVTITVKAPSKGNHQPPPRQAPVPAKLVRAVSD